MDVSFRLDSPERIRRRASLIMNHGHPGLWSPVTLLLWGGPRASGWAPTYPSFSTAFRSASQARKSLQTRDNHFGPSVAGIGPWCCGLSPVAFQLSPKFLAAFAIVSGRARRHTPKGPGSGRSRLPSDSLARTGPRNPIRRGTPDEHNRLRSTQPALRAHCRGSHHTAPNMLRPQKRRNRPKAVARSLCFWLPGTGSNRRPSD